MKYANGFDVGAEIQQNESLLIGIKTNVCMWPVQWMDSYPPSIIVGVVVSELVSHCAACEILKAGWTSPLDIEVTQKARVCYLDISRWIHCEGGTM